MSTTRFAALTLAGALALLGCDAQLANLIEPDPQASSSPSPTPTPVPTPTPTPEPLSQGIQLTLVASGSSNVPASFVPATGSYSVSAQNALSLTLSQTLPARLMGSPDEIVQLTVVTPAGPALAAGAEWNAADATAQLMHQYVELVDLSDSGGPAAALVTTTRIWTLGRGKVRLVRISDGLARVVVTDLVPTGYSGSAQGEFTLNATATLPLPAPAASEGPPKKIGM